MRLPSSEALIVGPSIVVGELSVSTSVVFVPVSTVVVIAGWSKSVS